MRNRQKLKRAWLGRHGSTWETPSAQAIYFLTAVASCFFVWFVFLATHNGNGTYGLIDYVLLSAVVGPFPFFSDVFTAPSSSVFPFPSLLLLVLLSSGWHCRRDELHSSIWAASLALATWSSFAPVDLMISWRVSSTTVRSPTVCARSILSRS